MVNSQLNYSKCTATAFLTTKSLVTRMEVASSQPDHLPTLSAAKTSELSLFVKLPFFVAEPPTQAMLFRLLLQCTGDIEANHANSGIVMDCADRNRETPHLGN